MDDQELKTTTKRTKNIGSRVCHCLLIVPLVAVVALASVSLGIFVAKKNEINAFYNGQQHGSCILYATYKGAADGHLSNFYLSSGIACDVSIWGEGALAVLGALLAVGAIIKAIAGVSVLNLLLFFELPIIGMGLLGSLGVAVNTAIGLAMTCDVYKTHMINHGSGSCSDFNVGGPTCTFYDSILQSEVAAWLVAAVLLLLFVIYVILMVAYCRRICCRRASPKYSRFQKETVQSHNPFDYGTTKSTNPFE